MAEIAYKIRNALLLFISRVFYVHAPSNQKTGEFMENKDYLWTDNPAVSGVAVCDTDVLNDCLMHLKYNNTNSLPLFFMLTTDRALTGEEGIGWALQGSYVTMTYPDAVNMIINEYDSGVSSTYRGISCKRSVSGRYIADISQKDAVDELYSTSGVADIYVVDKTNNAFYLPKTKWFTQFTNDINSLNKYNEPGLPNHQHSPIYLTGSNADLGDPGQCYMTNNAQQNGIQTSKDSRTGNVSNNSLYGKSSTVQPPSSNKFLYYKVGDVVSGATSALIDAQEYLEESLNDIENAVNDGLSALSDASDALNRNQITNCVLAAPNGIADYSGGTFTIKQGIKVIYPDGRNADGSLKNREYTTTEDSTYTPNSGTVARYLLLSLYDLHFWDFSTSVPIYVQEKTPTKFVNGSAYWYKPSENVFYWTDSSNFTQSLSIILGIYKKTGSNIEEWMPFEPVNILKLNDKYMVTNWAFPSCDYKDISLGASGTSYTAPASGWMCVSKKGGSSSTQYLAIVNSTCNNFGMTVCTSASGSDIRVFVPCKRGDVFKINYNTTGSTSLCRFIYAEGETL